MKDCKSQGEKTINIDNEERRSKCKEKLIRGSYTPLKFIRSISHTLGSLTNVNAFILGK